MARTPLLHALQQLARDFSEADIKNISVEEVQEQRRNSVSRRDLLKGAGVIAVGAALSGPFIWSERVSNALASSAPRIGIIGAGTARCGHTFYGLRSVRERRRAHTLQYHHLG